VKPVMQPQSTPSQTPESPNKTNLATASSNAAGTERHLLSGFRLAAPKAREVKQGIKTGLAGLIAYSIYAHFHLREGYWAVFTAVIVTQANLGASWRAALYRTIGTTCGALSAALLAGWIGIGPVRSGALLFMLVTFFAYLTSRHASFSAAGFTVALVLFFSHQQQPWELAWYRVLYTVMGAVIAFGVGVLVWPVRAREGLKNRIALLLEDCSRLTSLVTEGVLRSTIPEQKLEEQERTLLEHRRAITQGLEEARSEPARSRFDHDAYVSFVEEVDHIRQRLLAMSGDSGLYAEAEIQTTLVPSLSGLCQGISEALAALAAAVRTGKKKINLSALEGTVTQVEQDLTILRKARKTVPFELDRMLPFWSFVFNLKEMSAGVKTLGEKLPQLS